MAEEFKIYGNLLYKSSFSYVTIISCKNVSENIEIPDVIDNLPVTGIRTRAFQGCDNILSVTIPESVTTIENYCFNECASLKEVVLPSSITEIPEGCFRCCYSLDSINLDNITNFGDYAFEYCEKLDIEFAECVTTIGAKAFHHTGITNLYIPKSLNQVSAGCFSWCENLKSITQNPDNTTFQIIDDVLYYMGGRLLLYPHYKTDSSFDVSVSTIYSCAFEENTHLETLRITNKISEIGDLCGLPNLKNIEIYDYDNNCTVEGTSSGVYFATNTNTGKKYLMCQGGLVKVPADESEIASDISIYHVLAGAYEGCSLLSSVKIDAATRGLGVPYKCCYKCSSITDITYDVVPTDSSQHIGDYAFMGCDNLVSFNVTNRYTNTNAYPHANIGVHAFDSCENLKSFSHSGDTFTISSYAFNNCTSLDEVNIHENRTYGSGQYDYSPYSTIKSEDNTNKTMAYYNAFNKVPCVTKNDSCLFIGDILIAVYSTDIVTPSSNRNTVYKIFNLCPDVTSIELGDGVEQLDDSLFNCGDTPYLTKIKTPSTVTYIGRSCFRDISSYCPEFKELDVDFTNVTVISENAFYCSSNYPTYNMENIVINNNTIVDGVVVPVQIGKYAFEYSNVKSLSINCDTLIFNDYCFYGTSLQTVNIKCNTMNFLGSSGFYFGYCKNLSTLIIESENVSRTSGAGYLARNCYQLKEVVHSGSILKYDYNNCYFLSDFKIYSGKNDMSIPAVIEDNAFLNNYKLRELDLSNSVATEFSTITTSASSLLITKIKLSPTMKDVSINSQTVTEIDVPEGVENLTISCESLFNLKIPSTLKSLNLKSAVRKIQIPKGCTFSGSCNTGGYYHLVSVSYY